MVSTITKKISLLVALLAFSHFIFLAPHTLCSSLVEANGHAIELTHNPNFDDLQLIDTDVDGSSENDDHHHHCGVSVLQSTEANSIKAQAPHLNLLTHQVLSINTEPSKTFTQITITGSNRQDTALRGATGHFTQSVRLIS